MPRKKNLEIEKSYSVRETADKLRRLADALENGQAFRIQIGGRRVYVPVGPKVEIEYDRQGAEEEIEIEICWHRSKV